MNNNVVLKCREGRSGSADVVLCFRGAEYVVSPSKVESDPTTLESFSLSVQELRHLAQTASSLATSLENLSV